VQTADVGFFYYHVTSKDKICCSAKIGILNLGGLLDLKRKYFTPADITVTSLGHRQGYRIMPCPDGDFHVIPWRLSFHLISIRYHPRFMYHVGHESVI